MWKRFYCAYWVYTVPAFEKGVVWQELLSSFRERILFAWNWFPLSFKERFFLGPSFQTLQSRWEDGIQSADYLVPDLSTILIEQSQMCFKGCCGTTHKPGILGWWKNMIDIGEGGHREPILSSSLFFFSPLFLYFLLPNIILVFPTSLELQR